MQSILPLLLTPQLSPWINATPIIPAPDELPTQIRQTEGGAAVASAKPCADNIEQRGILRARNHGPIALEPTQWRLLSSYGFDVSYICASRQA